MSDPGRPKSDGAIDWDEARPFLKSTLARMIGPREEADLDDLVQEASVRLLRATYDTLVQDSEGLMRTVARRTWIDYLRGRIRNRSYVEWFGLELRVSTPSPLHRDEFGDLRERIEFVVQDVFEGQGAMECSQLAGAYFTSTDWGSVASDLGVSHATVRKRWSRCLALVREVLASDPDFSSLFSGKVP